MAESARQLPEENRSEIEPDIRPHLHALEGGGESSEPKKGHLAVAGDNSGSGIDDGGRKSTLAEAENTIAGGYVADKDEQSSFLQRTKRTLWGTKTRRRSTISGGVVGLLVAVLGGGSLWFSGPFELIHIAQFLQKAHFIQQEDAGDGRTGKLYRYLKSGGDAGETRLGHLGSKYKTQMLSDLDRIGLKPNYGSLTTYKGFTIDTTNKDSPYYQMDKDQVKAKLAEQKVTAGISSENGKITVTTDGYFGKNGDKASLRFLVKQLGYKGVSTSLRVRILAKYGIATWHPLTKLDTKLNAKVADSYKTWKENRDTKYKTGIDPSTIDANNAHTTTEDANGKPVDNPVSDADKAAAGGSVSSEKSSSVLKGLASGKTAGIAGGVAAVQGIVCGLKAVADNIGVIRYEQVGLPLMRMGMDAVTTGNQAMSGQDIDQTVAGFVAKSYNGKDSTGKVTSWNQAESIEAESGKSGMGTSTPEEIQGLTKGVPDWLAWTQSGPVGPFCSTAGQVIGGGVSVVLGVVSGGIISTVSGILAGGLLAPKAIDAASHFLSGEAVNVDAVGADWGSYINYGSRLSSNTMAMQFGGAALTSSEELALKQDANTEDSQDFANKSIAYRLFNAHDGRTLFAKLIDSSSQVQPQNIASTFSGVLTNFGALLRAPINALMVGVHADTTYDYGFEKYGFSKEDLNNPLVEDPYRNADETAKLLDGPSGQDFIDKAATCFGVNIVKTTDDKGNQLWDVTPGSDVNTLDSGYNAKDCRGAGDANWLRIRFFIFDTAAMEGWACYHSDSQSCINDGVTSESGTTSTASGGSFRIASYNVLGAAHTATFQDRLAKTVAAINDNGLDVVGLQEFEQPQRTEMLKQIGSTYDIYPSSWQGGGASVNSIIWNKSKFKLLDQGTQPDLKYFCSSTMHAPWVKLGLLDASGNPTGQQIYVMNVHDPATSHKPHRCTDTAPRLRLENAKAHVAIMKDKSSNGTPVFYTGDFNSGYTVQPIDKNGGTVNNDPNNLTYCVMAVAGGMPDSYDLYRKRNAKCPNPVPGTDKDVVLSAIDHIYMTPGSTVAKYYNIPKSKTGSDHDAVVADIVLPGSADSSGGNTGATTGKDFVGPDGLSYGWCTDYVKHVLLRHSSKYHGGSLGDGKDVANNLGKLGYQVNHTPAVHAVVSFPGPPFGYLGPQRYAGHVALVAQVNGDGTIIVEEFNFTNKMHYGTHKVDASLAKTLTYAHTEEGWH